MLYIHIPYCHHRCTYCAFYSNASRSGVPDTYVDALCHEIGMRASHQPVETVYLGGGTPSLLSSQQFDKVMQALAEAFVLDGLQEFTLECNPEDLPPHQPASTLFSFLSSPVNRLSIGIQSFRDDDLRLLNRSHTGRQAIAAVEHAAAGIANISVDLIYGLPGQSLSNWQENLRIVESLPVTHLSCYSLAVEEGTILRRQITRGIVPPAGDDEALSHYHYLLEWAEQHHFHQYEVSNFCRTGYPSRHNSAYWHRTPYMGFGAGAHSFDGVRRRWNICDAARYIESLSAASPCVLFQEETLSAEDACNEVVMLGLRTVAGICKGDIPPPFLPIIQKKLRPFILNRLVIDSATHFRPTPDGLLHADGIAADIML
ncbi:MAG: radical SAM family heme chaperone HemW [Bacteroidales bacterium]|nr:radical SAM family heme chaperone HemW [Bacteroidales bacterium]